MLAEIRFVATHASAWKILPPNPRTRVRGYDGISFWIDGNRRCLQTDLPFPVRRGKVRDVYDLGDQLLIVATDRISAFDCVMPNGIPDKGKILTAISLFWFDKFTEKFENHLIATSLALSARPDAFREQIAGRSMLVKKRGDSDRMCGADICRIGLEGISGIANRLRNRVAGGTQAMRRAARTIFTPATKEDRGHDLNISFEQSISPIGDWTCR